MIRYENSGVIRGLLQLIPYVGGASDTLIALRAERIKKERLQAFFDELASGKIQLTPEVVDSDDFLHCFFIATEAALSNRRREKIELFARLLKSTVDDIAPRDVDDFEELLSILDDLSFAEWKALLILDGYSKEVRQPSDSDLQWSLRFWNRFMNDVLAQLRVPDGEFTAFMNRISRTGLYEQFVGGDWDYSGGVGYLTPKFHRLKQLVGDRECSK